MELTDPSHTPPLTPPTPSDSPPPPGLYKGVYILSALVCLLLSAIAVLLFVAHRDLQGVGEKTQNVELRLQNLLGQPQWEYRVEAIPDDGFTAVINRLGAQGWEAVTARRASDGATYYPTYSYEIIFKRRAN